MIAPHIPFLTRFLRANRFPLHAKTLQSIEPKIRAPGEFARGAELDEPIEQAPRGAIGETRQFCRAGRCRFTLQCGTYVLLNFNQLAETEVSLEAFQLGLPQAF